MHQRRFPEPRFGRRMQYGAAVATVVAVAVTVQVAGPRLLKFERCRSRGVNRRGFGLHFLPSNLRGAGLMDLMMMVMIPREVGP